MAGISCKERRRTLAVVGKYGDRYDDSKVSCECIHGSFAKSHPKLTCLAQTFVEHLQRVIQCEPLGFAEIGILRRHVIQQAVRKCRPCRREQTNSEFLLHMANNLNQVGQATRYKLRIVEVLRLTADVSVQVKAIHPQAEINFLG